MIISVSWTLVNLTPLFPSVIIKKMMSGLTTAVASSALDATAVASAIRYSGLASVGLSEQLNHTPYTDGFVIPSLGIEDTDQTKPGASDLEIVKTPSPKAKIEENIYLGPHGAPPSQSKQQELNSSGRKQRFKQKLKEADKRVSGTGRENKLENLRELVGGGKVSENMTKASSRDWLDPHCHESQFEKWCQQ
ncbi:unnamed protein product [Dovyalis caffra]|uniref:Uncharacterized protein n=1 Tax=Dovyalis caffra TaxID=77055 RepID=A0AAV1QRY2_9ROSI|nr:unnamed protein product [Dovyalis caffra]